MKKYLGNKSKIANIIYEEVENLIGKGERSIFDAFSGTTNVGRYFKKNGFNVISNDVNEVSYVLGKTYIETNNIPTFEGFVNSNSYSSNKFNEVRNSQEFKKNKEELIALNRKTNDQEYIQNIIKTTLIDIIVYLNYYATEYDYKNNIDNSKIKIDYDNFIYSNYCKHGSNSEYINLVTNKSLKSSSQKLKKLKIFNQDILDKIDRIDKVFNSFEMKPYNINKFDSGLEIIKDIVENYKEELGENNLLKITEIYKKLIKLRNRGTHIGHRIFFSEDHGRKIDLVLNTLVYWLRNKFISNEEYYILLSSLLEAVALFSNTSATYQAFYKDYRDNTKQPFRLVFPEICVSTRECKVFNDDTFALINENRIDINYNVLYLDPPYNWRIYDSNYHLLNLVAMYHTIDDLKIYEQGILGASGEHRFIDKDYTNYNRRNTFETYLFDLILNSRCNYVVISYSNSRSNHNKDSVESLNKISNFLQNETLFEKDSYKLVEINSRNFESRKNETKDKIKELLFIAKKLNY